MTQTDQQTLPKLRFPGFKNVLESEKLGDVASFSKGKGISKNDIVPEGAIPCIRYGELYTVYDTVIENPISHTNVPASALHLSQGDEVLVPASGEDAKDIATAVVVKKAGVALGGDLNIIRSKNDGAFLASYLSGRKRMTLAAMAQGNSVVHLYPAQLKTLEVHLPTLPEQRKIADFLSAVDTKIAQLARKKALLEDYKKGCMQQLFSQAIRFKDDQGEVFPDWGEKHLGEVFEEVTDKVNNQKLPTYSISAGKGWVSQEEKFGRDISGQQNARYTALQVGDFSYNKGNSKSYKYGCVYPNNTGEVIAVPNVFISFRPRSTNVSVGFYAKLFENHFLDRGLRQLISSGARMDGLLNVNKSNFFNLKLPLPCPAEQRKIAEFLSALDAKIDLVGQELIHARSFKQGLLQQMFV